jgi:hypothetical protein
MRIALLAAAIILTLSRPASATSAIAVRTPTFIVLGADSKVVTATHEDSGPRCKIKNANDVFWVEPNALASSKTHFSLSDIATVVMSSQTTMSSRIAAFEDAIRSTVIPILNEFRVDDPTYFNEHLNEPWIEIAFASFEQGVPNLHVRSFVARMAPAGALFEIRRADAPSLNYPDVSLFSLGPNDAINSELSGIGEIGKWLEARGVDSAVRQLIEIETADRPDEVGPPIALVKITKSGALWGSDGKCGPS